MTKSLLTIFIFLSQLLFAQKNDDKIIFGFQFKPIIAASYFKAGDISAQKGDYQFELSPRFGQSLGMVLRYQLSPTFSAETGVNLVNRRYQLQIENNTISLSDFTKFNLRSYEIPLQLLSYVRLNQKYYLNASFGNAINIFPSDIISFAQNNDFFFQSTSRRLKIQSAFIAHLGLEYRTEENGIFYLGASFHRPWKNTARSFPEYNDGTYSFNTQAPSGNDSFYLDISGNYFTIDIRYFFSSK